jgi:hypothetical protein
MTRHILAIVLLLLASAARAVEPPVHRFAQPSYGRKYSGGLVGGGAALWGGDPYLEEGTWGVDYQGLVPFHRVWLGWAHGKNRMHEGKSSPDRVR